MSKTARKEVMVSVRMPHGLVEELRDLGKINHFMDLSDEIRFVLRKYFFQILNQNNSDNSIIEQKKKEKLIRNLGDILDELKEGQSQKGEAQEVEEKNQAEKNQEGKNR